MRDAPEDLEQIKNREIHNEESDEQSENEDEPRIRPTELQSQEVRDALDDSEWKRKREIHRQVTNMIKEIQREAGEDLLEPEDLAVEYRTSSKRKRPKKNSNSKSTRFNSSKYYNRAPFRGSPLLQKKDNGSNLHEWAR